jgi:predicted dehydrogenase
MAIGSFADVLASGSRAFDLVVVGTGPAGMAVAHALRGSGLEIVMLESGGPEVEREVEALNEFVNVGHARAHHELVRRRCVGGSSTIWTGRCGMFDAIDYQRRDGLPFSGWPFDAEQLDRHRWEAADLLGLAPLSSTSHALRDLRQDFDDPPWDPRVFLPVVWQFSRGGEDAETIHYAAASKEDVTGLDILRHSGRKTPVDFGRHREQLRPESRVRLSERQDRFGVPLPELDWRLGEAEFRTAVRFRELLLGELARLGIAPPESPAWADLGIDAWSKTQLDLAHPMCTTRMSDDPKTGVVDRDCRVHGVDGLFVAGSSVFATPGHMNPTMMLVALAVRLGEHLRTVLQDRPSITASGDGARVPAKRVARVGIVGAGDRVRRIYRPVLEALDGDVEVAGIASKGGRSAASLGDEAGWPSMDTIEDLLRRGDPDFLLVATPSAHNDSLYPSLLELGRPLLLETPVCWSLRTGRKLVRDARSRGVVVGVAEQFPFMPLARLRQKLVDLGVLGRVGAVVNAFAHWDYQGLAALRAAAGLATMPESVVATESSFPSEALAPGEADVERWMRAVFRYPTGETLEHRFSNRFFDSPIRKPRRFEVHGSKASLVGETLGFFDAAGQAQSVTVQRHQTEGRLSKVTVDTPLGVVEWRNPFEASPLDDEQIAVGSLVAGMARAAIGGGSPLYDGTEALRDMELLSAMRLSALRGGIPAGIPITPEIEKLQRVIRTRLVP